jgi:hypothetical protein
MVVLSVSLLQYVRLLVDCDDDPTSGGESGLADAAGSQNNLQQGNSGLQNVCFAGWQDIHSAVELGSGNTAIGPAGSATFLAFPGNLRSAGRTVTLLVRQLWLLLQYGKLLELS